MNADDTRHGTDAGYQQHRKDGEDACGPCRQAKAAYTRELRKDPYRRRRAVQVSAAASRALWHLQDAHPEEYQRLYAAELTAIRSAQETA